MGWTCQHDYQGYCKLIKKTCIPGMNGCILKGRDGIVFSTAKPENYNKKEEEKEEIDLAALARSN